MLRLRARIGITAIVATAAALVTVLLLTLPGLRGAARAEQVAVRAGSAGAAGGSAGAARVGRRARTSRRVDGAGGPGAAATCTRGSPSSLPDGRRDRGLRRVGTGAASRWRTISSDRRSRTRCGRGTARRCAAAHTVADDLVYAAVAVRQGPSAGRGAGGAAAARRARAGATVAARGHRRGVAGVRDHGAAVDGPLVLAGAVRSTSVMDAARQFAAGQPGRAQHAVPRTDELGELARILNRSADQLQERITEIARDRGARGRDPVRDGRRHARGGPRGVVLLANQALLRRAWACAIQSATTSSRRCASAGWARCWSVLRTGEHRMPGDGAAPPARALYALTGVPFPGDEARRRRGAHVPRRHRAAAAGPACAATSWPTRRTSCARRSRPSAASWRR